MAEPSSCCCSFQGNPIVDHTRSKPLLPASGGGNETGYYDNTIFHRVVPGFIVQGGDPTGTGTGGESVYGAPFKDEFHSRLRFNRRGLVAMANAGPHDNGSQFFFTLGRADELNNKHTIFGKDADCEGAEHEEYADGDEKNLMRERIAKKLKKDTSANVKSAGEGEVGKKSVSRSLTLFLIQSPPLSLYGPLDAAEQNHTDKCKSHLSSASNASSLPVPGCFL
ncbi:hypothetical protein CB1_000872008 [Camelus ferus]|nr:hypothetical protein CB1_000872008 [Camelus ferus]